MEYILVVSFIYLFYSLLHFMDTTDISPCTNKSLENNIPVVSFCKESRSYHAFIVLDGYYAHSNSDIVTCTCVIRGQAGRILTFNPPSFITTSMQSPCESEIKVSSTNSVFIIACISRGSIAFGVNEEIKIELTKKESNADTRYCILLMLDDLSSNFSVTCEGDSVQTSLSTTIDVMSTKTAAENTPLQRTTSLSTTNHVMSTTSGAENGPLQRTTTVSDDEALRKPTLIVDDKSTTGLIVSTVVGWIFGIVFGVTTVILLCQRRYQIIKDQASRGVTYDDLRARDDRNYSTMETANTGVQEYEIVTANTV